MTRLPSPVLQTLHPPDERKAEQEMDLEHIDGFHTASRELIGKTTNLLVEVKLAPIDGFFHKYPNSMISDWWTGKIPAAEKALVSPILTKLKTKTGALQKLVDQLLDVDRILPAFAVDSFRFHRPLGGKYGIPCCLAGNYLAEMSRNPPKSFHAALIDLSRGCLHQLLPALRNSWGAAESIVDQWTEAFLRVGGPPRHWDYSLQAERARARKLPDILDQLRQSAFVPNVFQRAILKALCGRALKVDPLAAEVAGGDRSRLYKPGGLKELQHEGLVEHRNRLGYYRPDCQPIQETSVPQRGDKVATN